jgi:hypothetical protein
MRAATPVLQDAKEVKEFNYVSGPTLRHYVRWEAPPHANRENQPNDILVAIPKDLARPAPVGLHLHCWGGSPWGGYGWWYNAEKGAILIAANQVPYDWWTGYHELYGKGPRDQKAWSNGVVHPYTQKRVLSLVDWAATQWEVDRSRVFTGGISMGGSGSPMLAIRNPDRIAWAIGWVGIHVPQMSSHFKGSYAQVYGEPEWGVKFEDGTPVWDYFSDVWYLRQHPARETPCTVDLTPRRLQTFKLKAGEALKWTSTSGGKETQSGALTVDPHGLATIEGLKVGKAGNRIRIAR